MKTKPKNQILTSVAPRWIFFGPSLPGQTLTRMLSIGPILLCAYLFYLLFFSQNNKNNLDYLNEKKTPSLLTSQAEVVLSFTLLTLCRVHTGKPDQISDLYILVSRVGVCQKSTSSVDYLAFKRSNTHTRR